MSHSYNPQSRYHRTQNNEPSFFDAFKHTGALSPTAQKHLVRVYAALTVSSALAAFGSYTHMHSYWIQGGLISGLVGFASVIGVQGLSNSPDMSMIRYGLLALFSFCQGLSLGPLLENVLYFYPKVLTTALVSTVIVFASLSASALFSRRRSWLFLGGMLGSALSLLLWSSLITFWIPSPGLMRAELYFGLAIFCGYVIYDTQLILERAEQGLLDVPGDCLGLFTDMIAIFVRILVLLSDSDKKKRKKSQRGSYQHYH